MLNKYELQRIDNAMQTLKEFGYYVDNLWHIEDVMKSWDCSEETALCVLDDAMQNDSTYEQVWCSIDNAAFKYNLKQIK